MPSRCRRIVVLLVAALLSVGGAPLTAAHAQSAGDQQYSDPFGDSDSGSSNSDDNSSGSNSNSGSSDDDDVAPLTPAPQTSGGGSSPSGSSGTSSGTAGTSASGGGTTTAAPAATLPNTGLDTRVLLLGGAVALLLGVGLRLRNAPERF